MPLPLGSTPFTDDDLKAIGEVVVAGASLDWLFGYCIQNLVQSHPEVGLAITAGLRTGSKIKMLGALGRIRLEGGELEEFKHALGEARALLKERDLLVHGSGWDVGETEDVARYFRVRAETGVEFRAVEVSKDRISRLSTDLGHARTRLDQAIRPIRARMRDARRERP